jgi:hypothetical protein
MATSNAHKQRRNAGPALWSKKRSKNKRSKALLSGAAAFIVGGAAPAAAQTITSFWPKTGGMNGGTMIRFIGEDFSS